MKNRRSTLSAAAACLLTFSVTGCSSDAKPQPTTASASASETSASSSSSSATSAVAGTDQSAAILSATLPAVKGSLDGKVDQTPATLNVADVRVNKRETILTFWHTGDDKMLVSYGEYSWERLPTLVDQAGKKVYSPLTFINWEGDTVCMCTDAAYIRGVPQPRTIAYPPLDESVTSIDVKQEGFEKPITVPVTREP